MVEFSSENPDVQKISVGKILFPPFPLRRPTHREHGEIEVEEIHWRNFQEFGGDGRSAKKGSAIDVRIDDAGSILKFRIGFSP